MKGELTCLRCGRTMAYMKTEKLQLGKTSLLLGDWPNIWAGALDVEIYVCPGCRKLELFQADTEPPETNGIAQKTCPQCGLVHDLDDPKCPRCRHRYTW